MEAWHNLGHQIAFSLGNIDFEQFRASDTGALYEIRNHSTVRPFMPSPEPLPFERHLEWVNAQLINKHEKSPLVMIGRMAGQPAGFGVIKPTGEPGVLEIGVIIAGERQRTLLPARVGTALFTIAAKIFGAHTLVSHVSHQHEQALRLNQGAGLIPKTSSKKSGETLFRTPTSVALSTPLYVRCVRGLEIHVKPNLV